MRLNKRNILFITWDGPQTNYLESLFFPIFKGLQDWNFYVVQFSWADKEKQDYLTDLANEMGIVYTHFNIIRSPHPLPGTMITVAKGIGFLKSYLKKHHVDVLMPRSTFPAIMAKSLKRKLPHLKIVFDADGLPLQERVDFSGLRPRGIQYKFLKSQETQMLLLADQVLVRSNHAKSVHLETIGYRFFNKFFKVINGRDPEFFTLDTALRAIYRQKLGLTEAQLLVVYSGSLGPQYGWEVMTEVFQELSNIYPSSRFLILTSDPGYLKNRVPDTISDKLVIVTGPYKDIPGWLNAADLAFAIRKPMLSMKGVSPIKLGEYLLMGLPTIASMGIGDSEKELKGQSFVHLFNHEDNSEVKNTINWVNQQSFSDKEIIRQFAKRQFTLKRSIEDYQKALEALVTVT